MIVFTDARCQQYESPGHPERPFRVQATEAFLKSVMDLNIEWRTPTLATSLSLERAHRSEHLDRVEKAAEAFDGDTPAYEGIWDYSRRATGAALDALEVVLKDKGVNAFSLMRPPGHHATAARAMGFCYLNHVATTALEAASKGLEKVAILDFDVHHGNGTEAILKGKPGFQFCSVHQHPCYPGTGTENVGGNCFNYPAAPRMPREKYRDLISRAMERLVRWQPNLLILSAGFDAYARDPIAQESLEAEDFEWVGQLIRGFEGPKLSVLEGGYSNDLPELIAAYLSGLEG